MKKGVLILLILVTYQVLFAGSYSSGITLCSEYFLSRHGDYYNPSLGLGYRFRIDLGEGQRWQVGGDLNANYFLNKEGVEGLFLGLPLKLSLARHLTTGPFNITPGFSTGAYLSMLKDDTIDYTGLAADIIAVSPYLELGPTLGNGSQILLIVALDMIVETAENVREHPVFLTVKFGYTFNQR